MLSNSTVSNDAHGEHLLVALRKSVLTLTINRPEKRNALRLDLLDALGTTLSNHANNDAIKVVVITATGNHCFAAGGDLQELDDVRSTAQAEAMSKRGRRAFDQIRNFPLPVVAALNGLALGGGAELAMACDLRIATTNAEIGFLQGQLAVTTAWGGGIDLIAATGSSLALDLLIGARRLNAAEALAAGLLNRVCATGESLDACLDVFLQPYLMRSRQVLQGFKALTADHRRIMHQHLSGTEQHHFVQSWTHADHWQAVEQAAAKRRKK